MFCSLSLCLDAESRLCRLIDSRKYLALCLETFEIDQKAIYRMSLNFSLPSTLGRGRASPVFGNTIYRKRSK